MPSISRNSRWTASSSSRWCTVTPGAQRSTPSYFSGSSVTTTTLGHAFGLELARDLQHRVAFGPSPTGWPPVIATASLKRIL